MTSVSMRKCFGYTALLASILFLAILPLGVLNAAPPTELVWGNNVQWQMVIPNAPEPIHANAMAQEDFYLVSTQFPPNHQSVEVGGDPAFHHDHVVPIPAGNHGGFTAVWRVFLVVCSSTGNSTGACTSGSGDFRICLPFGCLAQMVNGQHLTSDSAVEAAASAGLVNLIDTGVVFVCPIRPLQ